MKRLWLLTIATFISGCASMQEHPRVWAIASGVVLTSIVLSQHDSGSDFAHPLEPPCRISPKPGDPAVCPPRK